MASNVLYKTKTSDASPHGETNYMDTPVERRRDSIGADSMVKDPSLQEESQFAENFQQQHHRFRWGQGGAIL